MYMAILINEVRKELQKVGQFYDGDIEVLNFSTDVCILRLETEDSFYIVKYYMKEDAKKYAELLKKVEKYGIEIGVIAYSNKLIIFKDYERIGFYRNVSINDFKDEQFIFMLAKWYKKFQSIKDVGVVNKKNCFTIENINYIVRYMGIEGNELVKYIYKNFDNIKLKIDRIETSFSYCNFSLDNWMISKDNSKIVINNLGQLFEGFRWENIKELISFMDANIKEKFYNEYGIIKEEERIVSELISCIFDLVQLCKGRSTSWSSNECLKRFNEKKLYEDVKNLVEWY